MIEEKMHDDVISRQAVIELVKEFRENIDGDGIRNAYEEFMRDLEQLPSTHPTHSNTPNTLKTLDCIGRQEAIDALIRLSGRESKNEIISICAESEMDGLGWIGGILDCIGELECLPPAQPERYWIDSEGNISALTSAKETAEWVWDEDAIDWGMGAWVCSKCKNRPQTLWETSKKIYPLKWVGSQYCGCCGAKMERAKE